MQLFYASCQDSLEIEALLRKVVGCMLNSRHARSLKGLKRPRLKRFAQPVARFARRKPGRARLNANFI